MASPERVSQPKKPGSRPSQVVVPRPTRVTGKLAMQRLKPTLGVQNGRGRTKKSGKLSAKEVDSFWQTVDASPQYDRVTDEATSAVEDLLKSRD